MTFKELFKTILIADKTASRTAARTVRKFLYSSHQGREKYDDIHEIINDTPNAYAKITEDWRRENFVMAVSVIYYLHDHEHGPDFLFPWLLELLQNKNGYIRHAAVRIIQHELGPLTYQIRFPGKGRSLSGLSREDANEMLCMIEADLNKLAAQFWNSTYRKYKYIENLPSGTFKSVQLILSRLDDYCNEAPAQTSCETKDHTITRKMEIEQEIIKMLECTESDFTLEDVQNAIFHEKDINDMMKIVAMFDYGGDVSELDNILDLVSDAWNYFPHKALGTLSPAEKLLEYRETRKYGHRAE